MLHATSSLIIIDYLDLYTLLKVTWLIIHCCIWCLLRCYSFYLISCCHFHVEFLKCKA